MLEEDHAFQCPYCASDISVRLDRTGGRQQELVFDCTVCCRPIQIRVEYKGEEVVCFNAEIEE